MSHLGKVILACIAVGLAPLATAADTYREYRYHDIRVVSGGGRERAKLIAHNLYRLDAAMLRILGTHAADWRPKTTVYVIPVKTYFLIRGVEENSGSTTFSTKFDNTTLMNQDSNYDTAFFGAYYGDVSALMNGGYSFRWPNWFVKGLAEVMATAKVEKTSVLIGNFDTDRLRSLQSGNWIPTKTLLNIQFNDPQLSDADYLRTYSAECWFLVHQIIIEGLHTKSFFDYFSRLDDREPQDQAFAEAFGNVSYKQIDDDLRKAIGSRSIRLFKVPVEDEPDSAEGQVLDNAQVDGLFARVAADHGKKTVSASDLAKQSLAANANDENALYALARVGVRDGNFPQALSYADRLCGQDPAPSAQSSCGEIFSQLALQGHDNTGMSQDAKTLASRSAAYFQAAILHDPDDVASWVQYADLLTNTKDKERGTALLPGIKHAWARHAENDSLARGAAGLCSVTQDYDCAYKFALAWRNHASNSTSLAEAQIYADRMKTFVEQQALAAPSAGGASPESSAEVSAAH